MIKQRLNQCIQFLIEILRLWLLFVFTLIQKLWPVKLSNQKMFIFAIITLIAFINAYKIRLISLILKLISQKAQIKDITKEIITLEKELSSISIVNEFAKHVKLLRRINKLKDDKKEIVKENAFKVMKWKYVLISATYFLIIVSLITLLWLYRNEAVVQVPAHWLWPFSSFFDWSSYIPGVVTVPCWIAISSSASKIFAKHF